MRSPLQPQKRSTNVHSCLQVVSVSEAVEQLVVGFRPLSVRERVNADIQITAVNTNNGVSSAVCQRSVAPLEGSFLQL